MNESLSQPDPLMAALTGVGPGQHTQMRRWVLQSQHGQTDGRPTKTSFSMTINY